MRARVSEQRDKARNIPQKESNANEAHPKLMHPQVGDTMPQQHLLSTLFAFYSSKSYA